MRGKEGPIHTRGDEVVTEGNTRRSRAKRESFRANISAEERKLACTSAIFQPKETHGKDVENMRKRGEEKKKGHERKGERICCP